MKAVVLSALLLAAWFTSQAAAQNPGTITVTTTVNATAGTGATAVACTFLNSNGPQINCQNLPAGVSLVIPAPGAPAGSISGLVGSTASANSVSWIFTAGTAAGTWTYSVTANAQSAKGSF